MRDAHGVVQSLAQRKQGNFKLDKSRSVIWLGGTKNFPFNSEFEALLTFTGRATGGFLRSVTPESSAVTVRQHHSFVKLPDNAYKPRVFDPRSGYYPTSFADYATPIDQPLIKRWINRHRLEKKNPNAKMSEAVEPIVYYLDRGAPEPIRSALIEGASWWNQAFEAAGFKNAFQVKVLPEDADPMDVRYNVINWVHRSTRGWSYGSSVTDPRTGEIIKGHVLLGSLRVRQDFLIAQGLVEAYKDGENADPRLLEMALARLRQLSAHEVGHTLGLMHNFAASSNGRASVMDYPHPMITLKRGKVDFSDAYEIGIGDWDKRTIIYGYSVFPEKRNEAKELEKILTENDKLGFRYITDRDARPGSGAHPYAHLWDNGANAIDELKRMSELRQVALNNLSEVNIPEGTPMSELERVLVPVYLMHRYQAEGVAKIIGGVDYGYAARGDDKPRNQMVPAEEQRRATEALLETISPEFLAIPEALIAMIPPQAPGYSRDREIFKIYTGLTFDPIGAAESYVGTNLRFMLDPARLARLIEQKGRNPEAFGLEEYFDQILASTVVSDDLNGYQAELGRMVQKHVINHLLGLAGSSDIHQQVSAMAFYKVLNFTQAGMLSSDDPAQAAHGLYLVKQVTDFQKDPSKFKIPEAQNMPDGSPIGCNGLH